MVVEKKHLVWVLILCLNLVNNKNGVFSQHLQSLATATEVDQYRTGFHFQPAKNWMNDPIGPMYYNGIYHLFYQYNPNGAVWDANIIWAHSVSTDLINWISLEPAITPTEPFDINGCWSGSATILPGNKPVLAYTGIDIEGQQVQNVAYPKNLSDPYLREWIKPAYNPIIVPDETINATLFRDPSTAWWNNGHWNMIVGTRELGGETGITVLYKSPDFITWTKAQQPFHSGAKMGMWECPDHYPVLLKGTNGLDWSVMGSHVKHVLKVSLSAPWWLDHYTVGSYFPEMDRYVPDANSVDDSTGGLRYDYGKFYASKSFFDQVKNRRVLWAWVNESDTTAQSIAKGWAGIQSLPRTLWLDEGGRQLVQWPIKELETLRESKVHFSDVPLVKGGLLEVQGITAAQADVEVTFHLPELENIEPLDPSWTDAVKLCGQKNASVEGGIGPFGLLTLASNNLEEYTSVFFRVYKAQDKHVVLMCSGGERSSLNTEVDKPSFGGFVDGDLKDGDLTLRTLIDHSVVESFGAGGKICITSRVYPSLAMGENAHLYAFNNGTGAVTLKKLQVWNMKKIKIDNSLRDSGVMGLDVLC